MKVFELFVQILDAFALVFSKALALVLTIAKFIWASKFVVLAQLTPILTSDSSTLYVGDFKLEWFDKAWLAQQSQYKYFHVHTEHFDDSMFSLLENMKDMEGVVIGFDSVINGTGFTHLRGLKKLESIDFRSDALSDEGLKAISSLESLSVMRIIHNDNITDTGWANLREARNLDSLYLLGNFARNVKSTGAGLAALDQVRHLQMSQNYLTNQTLDALGGMKSLLSLRITNGKVAEEKKYDSHYIKDEELSFLENLEKLERLELYGVNLSGDFLKYLKNAKNLMELDIFGTYNEEVGSKFDFSHLSDTGISSITLGQTRGFADDNMLTLRHCPNLETLIISSGELTDRGFEVVDMLPKLKCINIYNRPKVTTKTLERLARLKSLEWLHIDGEYNTITIDQLAVFEKSNLKKLNLSRFGWREGKRNDPTHATFLALSRLKSLERLTLSDIGSVTRDDIDFLIQNLSNLKFLRSDRDTYHLSEGKLVRLHQCPCEIRCVCPPEERGW